MKYPGRGYLYSSIPTAPRSQIESIQLSILFFSKLLLDRLPLDSQLSVVSAFYSISTIQDGSYRPSMKIYDILSTSFFFLACPLPKATAVQDSYRSTGTLICCVSLQ